MAKFIRLTNNLGNDTFLNVEHIEQISKGATDDLTVIDLISHQGIVVKESPEQILKLINATE